MESVVSVLLGFFVAWLILTYFMPAPVVVVSTYSREMDAWPLELDDSNLAVIGVGLASPKPKPSVMDASPASSAKPVMMMMAPGPSPPPMMMMAPGPSPPPMMMMAPGQPPKMMVMAPGQPPKMMVTPAMPVSSTMTPAPSS